MLAGGDYPDAFHSVGLSTQDLITYGGQGVLIPLNDLIDKYAPNLKKILDENPDIKRGITMHVELQCQMEIFIHFHVYLTQSLPPLWQDGNCGLMRIF